MAPKSVYLELVLKSVLGAINKKKIYVYILAGKIF